MLLGDNPLLARNNTYRDRLDALRLSISLLRGQEQGDVGGSTSGAGERDDEFNHTSIVLNSHFVGGMLDSLDAQFPYASSPDPNQGSTHNAFAENIEGLRAEMGLSDEGAEHALKHVEIKDSPEVSAS